jgi:HAD superfamily hydrolase (TIGR01450 family)
MVASGTRLFSRLRNRPVTRIAWIGLGTMGGRIARRLVVGGHDVIAWNRTRGAADALASLGATSAETPADAARSAEVVITMVSDPAALQHVTAGADGIVSSGLPDTEVVIDMSTVGPRAIADLSSILPAEVSLLDAPVIGSVREADMGSLVIFVGGPDDVARRWEPLLSMIGVPRRMGPSGTGASAKLVANAALLGTIATLGEALGLARALGLPEEVTYRTLEGTPLRAEAERRHPMLESGEFPPRFKLALALKDAKIITEAATAVGFDMRVGRAVQSWLETAVDQGFARRDYTAFLATIRGDGQLGNPSSVSKRADSTDKRRLRIDGLIVDLDGVVWVGGDAVDGAAHAISTLKSLGIQVVYVTNEPKSSRSRFAARLTEMGIPTTGDEVLTSASATARAIASADPDANVLVVGPDALHEEIRLQGLATIEPDDAHRADVVVVGGHQRFDYEELTAAATALRAGARLFATGRDAVFPTPAGVRPGTGAVLAAIEVAGDVEAIVVGKPERIMFEQALRLLPDRHHVAVVGDHLVSDIAGARRAGLVSILVLTGVTTRADLDRASIRPDHVVPSLAELPRHLS